MTYDETAALWAQCEAARKAALETALGKGRNKRFAEMDAHKAAKGVWNAWAEAMLRRREAIVQAGRWAASVDAGGRQIPHNEETGAWFRAAVANFSRATFNGPAAARPGDRDRVVDAGDQARFSGFIFPGAAIFRRVRFTMTAWFEKAVFHGNAVFEEAVFSVDAWFEHAKFMEATTFDEAVFAADGWFENAEFLAGASFVQASFKGYTSFSEARFANGANFTAISGERAFLMAGARFEVEPPSFIQADFKTAPRFDHVHVPVPAYFSRGDRERAARYRTLRHFADAGLDHERERTFFKGEVRSRRWTEDTLWTMALWLGMAYDAFSDFGRSVAKPMVLWAASLCAAAWLYLAAADGASGLSCAAQDGTRASQAMVLALKNALVLTPNFRDHRITQAYHCLFGGPADAPAIPIAVTLAEMAHTVWSAALIFLLLLAVRNQFRIR